MTDLKNRILGMFTRFVLTASSDGAGLQKIRFTGLADEEQDEIERFQQYGFTGNPLPGAEGLAAFVGGNREHGYVIAVDDRRYRIHVEGGEVAVYDDLGQVVHLKRDGIEISSPLKISMTAPQLVFDGPATFTKPVAIEGIDFKTHVHGGVNPGSGNTGGPHG